MKAGGTGLGATGAAGISSPFLNANWRKNCLLSLFHNDQNTFSDLSTSLDGILKEMVS